MKSWIPLIACAAIAHAHGADLFTENFEKVLDKRWEPVKFEGTTQYSIFKDSTGSVLRAYAASSASGIGARVVIPAKPGTTLSWRWKIDKIPPSGSDDTKKTFDHTARLFVAFKTLIGPPRTINYVWANQTDVGKTFHHPSSGRARFVVLQNGNAKAGQWITESRDLHGDWKKLFGNDDPPQIVSVGLMTDSDGTESTITGFYDDIKITAP